MTFTGMPLSSPKLSICIPTYNFGAFISETLTSIVNQELGDTEVVVLDGGSTDDTAQVVEKFRGRIERLTYIRRESRGGIDRDIEYAVEAASGEYVWLFSADDVMVDGAVANIISRLSFGDDVLACETVLCDLWLGNGKRYQNTTERAERVFSLSDPCEKEQYLRLAKNTQALFSFCGSVIFRRERWESSPYDGAFVGSCWSHVARILSLIPGGLKVRHIPKALSLKRGDNDSFAERGIVHRLRIGIEGYLALAKHYFGSSGYEIGEVKRLLAAEYTLRHMLAQKEILGRSGKTKDIRELLELYNQIRSGVGGFFATGVLRFAPCKLLTWLRMRVRKRSAFGINEQDHA